MSGNDLEILVNKLNECSSNSTETESSSIIGNIINSCNENMSPQTISYCMSIFFVKEKNLLTFLRKVIGKPQFRKSKCELLDFIHRFICATGKQTVQYACEIKDTCISLFDSETYSDVRMSTFQIIAKLIEITVENMEIVNKFNLIKLAETYFKSLDRKSATSATVKAGILRMLGLMCRYHPAEMNMYAAKCLDLFLSSLKAEMNSKHNNKPELNVIAGALDGLTHYLFHFTQSENAKESKEIFDYIYKALLNNSDDVTRYAMPKAALILLAKHASQFDESIYSNYNGLFNRIKQWAQHKNYDMKKQAYFTLDSFYVQLAEMLKKKSQNEPDKCKQIFSEFIKQFYQDLTDEDHLDLKETVIAIKGYGAFAGPCREFMQPKDVRSMFEKIISICERTFFLNMQHDQQAQSQQAEIFDEKIYQLPSFIESLSCVCNQIDENISETSMNILEKLVILAIDSYPKLIKRYNHQISLAISRLFLSIQKGSQQIFCAEFVSKIVYQSLVKIFSYKTNYYLQPENQKDNQNNRNEENTDENSRQSEKNIYNITSSDYILLWSNLLNLNEFKELNELGFHVSEKKILIQRIYDEIIETILKIVKKLDLNAVKQESSHSEQESQSNDSFFNPGIGMRACRPRDFEILVNLVDFSRELLMQKHHYLFEKWIYKYSKEIIKLSSSNSLISGFYKLNTLCMRIAVKIDYFSGVNNENQSIDMNAEETEEINVPKDSFNDSSNQIDDQLQFEKYNCFHLFKKYIKEIYVRKKQFKDELLAACLEFFLSLPKELVLVNLNEVFESLENSLELGINYLPMAENALTSLEYWIKSIELSKLKSYYGLILNKFDDYLQMNRGSNFSDDSLIKEKTLFLKISYKGSGRKKLPIKLFEKNTKLDNWDIYEQIQLRILVILGQLAGQMSHCLFETNQNSQIIAWDTVQHLKFSIPFVDIKPQIYFDRFLSRIIYLSLSSTNRQTKVNSCELLHAIVIYMIGKSVSDPLNLTSAQYQMNKIYHYIYPALFKLSCDVDNFARNLFQPLVMQMIHWFTGNRKYESLETVELLNCIMDSLVDEKDAALRDFSAVALKEFLKWSIKHTPLNKQNTINCSVNAKSILKRIFSLLNHSNCAKRLGAALAWNSIYTIFREEESLVNKYTFELLYNLIESLALAEHDDKMYGTQEQTKLALDHTERIIKVKVELLNQRNAERVKPPGWSESVLEVCVRWLMRQCGRIETECRHTSMGLVYKLAPLLAGNKEAKDYFQNRLNAEGESYFLDRFEGSAQKKNMLKDSLCHFQTLRELIGDGNCFQIGHIKTWLSILIAPLDCYSWVFSQRLLTPKNLFASGKSCIWLSLEYFIKNIMTHDLDEITKNETNITITVFTPNELEEFKQAKCTAIVRTIDFLVTMISYFPSESFSMVPENKIWCDPFFECLLNMCLDPRLIGFNLNSLEVYTNLPLKTKAFFKIFTQYAPSSIIIRVKTNFAKQILEKKELEKIIDAILSKTNENQTIDWIKLSQLVTGHEQLSEFNLFQLNLELNRIIFEYLCRKIANEQESLTCVEAKRKLLNLCLGLNYLELRDQSEASMSANDYLIELLDKYLFQEGNVQIYQFFNYFKSEICAWICKRVEFITKYILGKIKLNFSKAVSLLITLIDYLATDKIIRKQYGSKVVNSIYSNWNLFNEYWQSANAQLEHKLLLVDLLTKSILIESINKETDSLANQQQVTEMYMNMLIDKKTKLTFKCKLLDLLCFFSESPEPFKIKTYLNQMISDQFPLRSSELTKGENYSKDYLTDYTNAIRKILTAIDLCGSFDLIKEIVNVCCREAEHLCDEDIHSCLSRFIRRVDSVKQNSLIGFYWEMVFKVNDQVITNERKSYLFKKVLMTFLTNCDKSIFLDFVTRNITTLISILDTDLKEFSYGTNALNKKIVFDIINLSYKRLHKDEIFHPSAKLCQSYEQTKFGLIKDGKELTKEVLRKCRKYLCEEIKFTSSMEAQDLDQLVSLQYQMHCSAYNCLCSLFIRTQTEPKLYQAFLFKDDVAKNELIFERLIDSKKQYKFSIEIENIKDRKSKFITLRNEFKDSSMAPTDVNYISSLHTPNTVANNYLNMESMHISSLSEELSIFDFTSNNSFKNETGSTLSMNSFSSGSSQTSNQKTNYFNFDEVNQNIMDSQTEIESDDLNHHESMSSLVQLIKSLHANKITPIYENDQLPTQMPPWMEFLQKKVKDMDVHLNVKLLIVRAIINTEQFFKAYAKFWYSSLIGFLVNAFSKEDTMDYFTLDLMVVLLSWNTTALPQASDQPLIKSLFESLMKRCYHDNRAVLKNNLELLKTMTECWKNVIEVPVELINNGFLKSSDPKKQSTGIQLIGLILANQINSYKMMPGDQNGMEFFKLIISFIKDKSKMLHASSSEVVGMLFKSLESQIIKIEKEQFAELFEFVRQIILGFEEDSQFITCLHKIQLNYSKITEPFLSRLVFKMPGLYGEFKQMCAECILASLPKLEDKIFNTKLFTDMITNRDSLLQLVCLKMIYTMLDQQTEEDLNRLLPIVCSFKTHSNAACRYQMILILISLFEKFNLENRVSKVLQLVNETLLIVLLDEDQSIRILAQNFWCEKANMPTSTIERLVKKIKEEKFPKLKKTSKSEIMSRNEIFFRANV